MKFAHQNEDEGVVCSSCEHFNQATAEYCSMCGIEIETMNEFGDAAATSVESNVVCTLRPEEADAFERLIASLPDSNWWFPGELQWDSQTGSLTQHLPDGMFVGESPKSILAAFDRLAAILEDMHAHNLRANCLFPNGLVLNAERACRGLIVPASLSRLDCPADATPVSGLNCCFAAPEVQQFIDASAGAATDVFTLAALFHNLRTGATPADLIACDFEWNYPDEFFGPALRDCLSRALAMAPDDRHQSPAAFVKELREAVFIDSSRCTLRVLVTGHSHIGLGGRSQNEDAFGVLNADATDWRGPTSLGAAVVADGIGGGRFGERASASCVNAASKAIQNPAKLFGDELYDRTAWPENAARWVLQLNETLMREGASLGDTNFGSTFSGLVWLGDWAVLIQVGDSVVYRLRDGELTQLSVTQNLASQLRSQSDFNEAELPEDAELILVSSLGSKDCQPQTELLQFQEDDLYLLISDGIGEGLAPDEIREILQSGESLHSMVREIFRKSRRNIRQQLSESKSGAGSIISDNQTAVIVSCSSTLLRELVLDSA